MVVIEKFTATGYVYKMHTGVTERKAAKFIITESESPYIFIPIDPYQSLPSYSPLILYTLILQRSNTSTLYEVERIIKCTKRYSKKGVPKKFAKKFFKSREHAPMVEKLPERIRTKDDIFSSVGAGPFSELMMDVYEPYFRGPSFLDLLRYSPSAFLYKFTDKELDYLLCVLKHMPFCFCFRGSMERFCCTEIVNPNNHKETLFGKSSIRLGTKYTRQLNSENELVDTKMICKLFGNNHSKYEYAYNMRDQLTKSTSIKLNPAIPLWSVGQCLEFCKDHAIPMSETQISTLKEAVNFYLMCDFVMARIKASAFDTSKTKISKACIDLLVGNGILINGVKLRDELAIDVKLLRYPDAEVAEFDYVLSVVHMIKNAQVYILDGRMFNIYMRIKAIVDSSGSGTMVLCSSRVIKEVLRSRSELTCTTVSELNSGRFESSKIDNVIYIMPHEVELSEFTKSIKILGERSGEFKKLILIASKRSKTDTFNDHYRCFKRKCPTIIREYVETSKVVKGDKKKVANYIKNNSMFELLSEKRIGSIEMRIYDTIYSVGVDVSRWCNANTNKNKTRYITCTSEVLRSQLAKDFAAKSNCIYGPGVVYINKRARVKELGFDGILIDAKRLNYMTNEWVTIEQMDSPIYCGSTPYLITIMNEESISTVTVRTDQYTCCPSDIDLVRDVPFSCVDSVLLFIDSSTTYNDIMKMATMYKIDLILYVKRGTDVVNIFNTKSKIGANGLMDKMNYMLRTRQE